jgi:hypothetical protein
MSVIAGMLQTFASLSLALSGRHCLRQTRAFAQGSEATKQSSFLLPEDGLLRFARNDG